MVIKVQGVNPRLVCSQTMASELGKLGLNTKGSIPTKIERLVAHIRTRICGGATKEVFEDWVSKNMNHPDVVICEPGCGGVSTLSGFDKCPYCGDKKINMPKKEKPKMQPAHVVEPEVIDQDYLDQNVNIINNLKLAMSENYYALGLALKENEEKCLWALRKKKSGEPKYKDFSAWARNEVKLGRTQANKCIRVVENFSEEEVRRIGHSKLAIALNVPQEHRQDLLKKAEEGASKRELEQEAAKLKGKPDKITVAYDLANKVLPMFCYTGDPDEEEVPAFCVADKPYTYEEMSNGVVQSYLLTEDKSGQLILIISRTRPE